MSRHDWYRNKDWNDAIEEAFFTKLGRARNKPQFLRIQAGILAEKYPAIALRLLDQYFTFGDHFEQAQAYVDRASAYLSLEATEKALSSYESALAVEARRRGFQTYAFLHLPFVVASYGIKTRFEQALRLLDQYKSRLTFPVDHFRWHAAYALILLQLGQILAAREHARHALNAADQNHSGFRYHPDVGLVGKKHEKILQKLTDILA